MHHDVIMAGFGGQGILMIGNLLAVAGLKQGLRVTFFPSYGVEMRGGTANCTVTLSDREIGSPVTSRPFGVIGMNEPSAAKFGPRIREGGVLVVNASLVSEDWHGPEGIRTVRVPCNRIALDLGDGRLASMVALGAYVGATGVVEPARLEEALPEVLPEKAHKLIPLNLQAIEAGRAQAEG
ncbi:MAG: 2-oxoacid:acceptor oxidoreductase family protein [Deferrisomatales bacterium]